MAKCRRTTDSAVIAEINLQVSALHNTFWGLEAAGEKCKLTQRVFQETLGRIRI